MALVSQEASLFATTIYENIAMGRPEASREEVLQAAKAALVDSFVGLLPQGYDTHVGSRGIALSGGQRQRIAIARAILKNPRVRRLSAAPLCGPCGDRDGHHMGLLFLGAVAVGGQWLDGCQPAPLCTSLVQLNWLYPFT